MPTSIAEKIPRGIGKAVQLLFQELKILRLHARGVRKARQYAGKSGLKLNIGCGTNVKPGWVNIDLGPKVDLTLDMRRDIPLANNSVSTVYSEHFFEHVEFPVSVEKFLAEALRVLEPGGRFSVGVPDTEWIIREYNGLPYKDYKPGEWVSFAKSGLHPDWCHTTMDHINYHFRQYTEHKYAYDYETLAYVLGRAGFVDIKERESDPTIDAAWRKMGTLYVEARKPA